ncbi:MAG: SdiA-regulated domain-containing protein [Bacteroidota bacterium]
MTVTILLFMTGTPLLLSQSVSTGLQSYDLDAASAHQMQLDKSLREISGMATHPDGRLFAHHDEHGDIFEIELKNGRVLKKFTIGIADDFEGMAIVGTVFYLVTNSGIVYEFQEGRNNERVRAVSYATSLDDNYDVEGLCYDPGTTSLLLACKGYSGLKNSGYKGIFAFSLESKTLDREPRFLIPLDVLKRRFGGKPFRPSGIEYNANSRTFFVIDSEIRSIIELSRNGEIIAASMLDRSLHKQPEGIAFDSHGHLLIGDEGTKKGTLTRYKRKK